MNFRPLPCRLFILFNFLSIAVVAQQPTISSITPAAAPVGSAVTINGSNFSTTPINNSVFFGATKASVTTATASQLVVSVLAGALHLPITVGTNAGTAYSAVSFLPTFPGSIVNFTNRSYATPVEVTAGAAPESVVFTDLDGDGKPEMVTTNSNGSTISVFKNTSINGTAAFATKVDFAAGATPWGIATGDLNADGKPDIAITNLAATPKVSVFINTSSGGIISFATRVEFAAGISPRGIDINDIDADGKPDIVCANWNGGSVSVLQNTTASGILSFAPKVDYAVGNKPYNVLLRDIDGDGKADIALSNESNSISVLRNTSTIGNISFAAKIDFTADGGTRGIACGDIDGDGKADIATANFGSANVSVLKNISSIGNIAFDARVDIALSSLAQTDYIAISDLTGDSKPDIAVPDFYSGNLQLNVFRNTSSNGTIGFASRVFYNTSTGSSPKNIAAGDVDGDGRPDVALVYNGANKIAVFRNIAPPVIQSFSPSTAVAGASVTISGYNFRNTAAENNVFFGAAKATITAASNTSLTVTVPNGATYLPISVSADGLTGHAKLPFVLTFAGGDSIIANSFTARKIFTSGSCGKDACIADFDGDGKNDVAIHTNSTLSFFRNTSTIGNISFAPAAATVNTFNSALVSIVASDLNGDGKAELITADGDANTISVYRNTSALGSISLTTPGITISVSAVATNAFVADLNDDGRPEIIASTTNYVAIIPNISANTTSLTFGSAQLITMVNYLDHAVVADFDNDGKTDIVSGQSYLRNTSTNGAITFGALTNFSPMAPYDYYVTADFNSDGKIDIAALKANERKVLFYNNTSTTGNISFSLAPNSYTTGISPKRISAGDLNGDGKPDIAVADADQDAISVFANASTGSNIVFIPKVNYEAGYWPYAAAIGDLDGDAKPDIVMPNWQRGFFSVLRFNVQVPPPNIPEVISFTPISGRVGDTITINGNNFGNTAADNIVLFGGVKATILNANATSLQAIVPVGAAYAPFSITNASGLTGYAKKIYKITFPGAGPVIKANAFDSAKIFNTGDFPWAACVGDLDGDGKNDVATANYNANNVSVFRNTSVPRFVSFDAKIDLAVGSQPQACTMADLNADGKLELIVANAASSTLSIFSNISTIGNIIFASPITVPTDSSGNGYPVAVAVYDIDGDGKPDVIVANKNAAYITFFRNLNTVNGGAIVLGQKIHFGGGNSPSSLAIKDMDGNGKPDVVVGSGGQAVVLNNTSIVGTISFTRGEAFATNTSYGLSGILAVDMNQDDLPDMVIATGNDGFSKRNNQSIRGTHFFGPVSNYGPVMTSRGIAADDFDGDERPDVAMADLFNKSIDVLKNNYVPNDTPDVKSAIPFTVMPAPLGPVCIATGDIDGDGKPDIITTVPVNYQTNYLAILRNNIGAPTKLCANGGVTLLSTLSGSTYQWQVSIDNGVTFANITNNANYSGATTIGLQLSNIPSMWTGYEYRCVSGNGGIESFVIRFYNTWTGAISNQWENPGNWSCGTVPDLYTDVVIEAGATININSNITIAALTLSPGASLTVHTPFILTVTGH